MTREERIIEVSELSKLIKSPIPITRYIRQRIVQEEIIDAYKSPVPSAVIINGKSKMVEIGDWVVIREDGSQDAFKPSEFNKTFEIYQIPNKESLDGRRK